MFKFKIMIVNLLPILVVYKSIAQRCLQMLLNVKYRVYDGAKLRAVDKRIRIEVLEPEEVAANSVHDGRN